MKKLRLSPTIIGLSSGTVVLVSLIILMIMRFSSNSLYSFLMVGISALLIILMSLGCYFVHDRICGLVMFIATNLGLAGLKNLYNEVDAVVKNPEVLLLLMLLAFIASFAACILSVYRLPINQQKFDNNIFGDIQPDQKPSTIIAIINVIVLGVLISNMIFVPGFYVTIVLFIVIGLIITGKILTLFFKNRFGSLLIAITPFILILGINQNELGQDNSSVLLMMLEYLLSITLVITEMVKYEPAEEAKIGPKEYKK